MANEAVDALFAMGLPVPLGVVRSLVEGIDGILQRCCCFGSSLPSFLLTSPVADKRLPVLSWRTTNQRCFDC